LSDHLEDEQFKQLLKTSLIRCIKGNAFATIC